MTAFERAVADAAGEFRDRVRRLVGRLDAGVMRRRRDRRVRGRRVIGRHDRDGVGYLSGTDLPVESVAAAYEYVDAIAQALKNEGDPRPVDALRADIYTDLLTGGSGHRRYDLFGQPDDDHDPRPPAEPSASEPVPEESTPQDHVPDDPVQDETAAAQAWDESADKPPTGRVSPTVRPRPVHVVAP